MGGHGTLLTVTPHYPADKLQRGTEVPDFQEEAFDE